MSGVSLHAQTVSGNASTTGCKDGGTITPVTSGISNPQFQLRDASGTTILRPVGGGSSDYLSSSSMPFTGLKNGTYIIKERVSGILSSPVTVSDGYTPLLVSANAPVVYCEGGNSTVTVTVSGGKANYTYKLLNPPVGYLGTTQSTTGAVSVSFANLPVGTEASPKVYNFSVTDNCGQAMSTSISLAPIGNLTASDVRPRWGGGITVRKYSRNSNCAASPMPAASGWPSGTGVLFVYPAGGFVNKTTSMPLSYAEASKFSWYYVFNGQRYGADVNGDGLADVNGPPAPVSTANNNYILPPPTLDRAAIMAGTMKAYVISCGDFSTAVELSIYSKGNYNYGITLKPDMCGGTPYITATLDGGYATSTLPFNYVFTDVADESKVITVQQTQANSQQLNGAFEAGHTYYYTATDCSGFVLYSGKSNRITMTNAPAPITAGGITPDVRLGYGYWYYYSNSNVPSSSTVTFKVLSSTSASVPVGTVFTKAGNNNWYNSSPGPLSNIDWPMGTYAVEVTAGCATTTVNVRVTAFAGKLTTYTTEATCGGFNLNVNLSFVDRVLANTVDNASTYEAIIVSGPNGSGVGSTSDFTSTDTYTGVARFNNLSSGTYTIGLRLKGSDYYATNSTITVSYSGSNILTVDESRTGGFVCYPGAPGTLNIIASSTSPAPNNTLSYALLVGGVWTAYQANNSFPVTNGSYTYRVKDGCENVITKTVQIGVGGVPVAYVNGKANEATLCEGEGAQLDVDVAGATSYSWVGPGINSSNKNTKNPFIPAIDLSVGTNNYSLTIMVNGCSVSTTISAKVKVNPLPNLVINAPAAVCAPSTIDLTQSAVTAGSSSGITLSYFNDLAATNVLNNPSNISISGTYYIKATFSTGCFIVKPVTLIINPMPVAIITSPAAVCSPATVDLTAAAVTNGSTGNGLTFSYYTDAAGTQVLSNPATVSVSGTYYIRPKSSAGCLGDIRPVNVVVNPKATLVLSSGNPVQTVCSGNAITNIVYQLGGSGNSIEVLNLPSGLNQTWDAASKTLTISGTPTASGSYTLNSIGQSSPCANISLSGTINVNALPAITLTSSQAEICQGDRLAVFAYTGALNAPVKYSVSWSSGINAQTDVNLLPNVINITTPGGLSVGTYTGQLTLKNANGCTSNTLQININVKPKPAAPNLTIHSAAQY